MQEKLVSIIMPVYNAEAHLKEAVESILNQDYRNIEFIIIDDGSTDNSSNIIDEYAKRDARIVVIRRENRGIAASLNEGVDRASGDYVARMDSDDIALKHRISTEVKFLEKNGEIDFCGSNVYINSFDNIRKYPLSGEDISKFLYFGNAFAHPTIMWKRGVVSSQGQLYDGTFAAEDYELWTRLIGIGKKGANIEEPLLIYRVDGNNISVRKMNDMLWANHHIRERYCKMTRIEYNLTAPFELMLAEKPEYENQKAFFLKCLNMAGDNTLIIPHIENSVFENCIAISSKFSIAWSDYYDSFCNAFGPQFDWNLAKKNIRWRYIKRKIKKLLSK